ncbi:MAG: hypothetical protein KA275_05605, partial [Chitinophagaceae bacterium]|nr:hypothetical protein [Chitinophagaceae bacterium]
DDGIRVSVWSRGLGDMYKRQHLKSETIDFDSDTTVKQSKIKNFIRIINPFDLRGKKKNTSTSTTTTTSKIPKPKNFLIGTLSLLLSLAAFASVVFYFPVAIILAIGAIILGFLGVSNKEDPLALAVIGITFGGLLILIALLALIAILK